jgi:hypothetical protein
MQDIDLWEKISRFEIAQGSQMPFEERLAIENRWPIVYARRVIDEYKRFIYLCCVYGKCTPSDPVDQAWHLHLTYTNSYWVDFCRRTLERRVEHNPTKGGAGEAAKHRDWYERTLQNYQLEFQNLPPEDIWPDTNQRFKPMSSFVRVDLDDVIIIRKKTIKQSGAAAAVALVLMGCAAFSEQSEWLLIFGILVIVVAAVVVTGSRKKRRSRLAPAKHEKQRDSNITGCGSASHRGNTWGADSDGDSDSEGGCDSGDGCSD